MADICIFCGQPLKRFGQKTLLCGNVMQPVCGSCLQELAEVHQEERGRRALETGRAVDPERIQQYLEQKRQAAQRARQSVMTGKTCLRCGGQMLSYGRKLFQLGSEGLFGPVARDGLFSEFLEADILRCEVCGKAEFFILDEEAPAPSGEEDELITCPVCGTRHSGLIGCPSCALNGARSSSVPPAPPRKKEKTRKPPWER